MQVRAKVRESPSGVFFEDWVVHPLMRSSAGQESNKQTRKTPVKKHPEKWDASQNCVAIDVVNLEKLGSRAELPCFHVVKFEKC